MQLKWTSSPRNRGLENFEVRPSLSTIQIYSSSQNASLCSAPAPDQMGPRQRSWARFASPQHGQSEPQSVGRSGGAGAQGSGCKMPMFMSVLYGRSQIDCGFDATQDSCNSRFSNLVLQIRGLGSQNLILRFHWEVMYCPRYRDHAIQLNNYFTSVSQLL